MTVKPKRFYISTFSIVFLAEETGCKRPELDLDGPCILSESGEL